MPLIPPSVLASVPGLDVDLPDDPLVHVLLAHRLGAAWHVLAGSVAADGDWILFVFADLGEPELGYASLRELEEVRVAGASVERDTSFVPVRLSKVRAIAQCTSEDSHGAPGPR